jgi:hypothetical protein
MWKWRIILVLKGVFLTRLIAEDNDAQRKQLGTNMITIKRDTKLVIISLRSVRCVLFSQWQFAIGEKRYVRLGNLLMDGLCHWLVDIMSLGFIILR